MDLRESAAPQPHIPPQYHHQQTLQHHHQPPSQHHHQHHQVPPSHVMMMAPPPNSYTPPQIPNHNATNNVDSSTNTSMMQQNPRFPFNSAAPKPLDSMNSQYADGSSPSSGFRAGGFSIETARKKRGRPRKYSPDGNIALGLSPSPVTPIPAVAHVDSGGGTPVAQDSEASPKKGRGRPAGSGKKQLDALGSPGVGFTPHVIAVNAGEDVAAKIMAFSQQGPRTICILSANGPICNVTLRQPTSGGAVTYEGRFEIISLSGSFSGSESNGTHSQAGALSVSLAGTDGRVLGGVVAGVLKAAGPIQVIVGSFIADGKKPKSGISSAPPPNMLNFGAAVPGVSPPDGGSSESSDESGSSPLDQGPGTYGHPSQPMQPMYGNIGWANSTINMLPN